ncbi:MAG: hypothetical protein AB7S75_10000 [Desulfococcaceae bacterium]
MKIKISSSIKTKFPFAKYINRMLSVIPQEDVVGISMINIVDKFVSNDKNSKESMAQYLIDKSNNSLIEINISRIIAEKKIPEYLFNLYPEIAALLLSEIVFHEIGHHVHHFKRHGIKKSKKENFADIYAKVGYFNYIKSHYTKILSSYRWAYLNFFCFDKNERKAFQKAKNEIEEWMNKCDGDIDYP